MDAILITVTSKRKEDMMKRCPDENNNPDDCHVCHGWGHLCTAWRRTHPQQLAKVQAVFESGWDPTRFYHSIADAQAGEQATAQGRKKE